MTPAIMIMLGLLGVALVLFWTEWLEAEVVAMGLLIVLMATGLLPVDAALAGFGSETVVMILGLLVMSAALQRTGGIDLIGRLIVRHVGENPRRLKAASVLSVAGLSAFVSNTAAAALFLPTAIGLSRRSGASPGKLLMPVAFAAIVTSGVTLISTSTNLVVSGLMDAQGMEPLRFFELAPVGVPIAVAGVLYMIFVMDWFIPDRGGGGIAAQLESRPFLTEAFVPEGSAMAGSTLEEAGLGQRFGVTVLGILRGGARRIAPLSRTKLEVNDVLLLEADADAIQRIREAAGIEIRRDMLLTDEAVVGDDVRMAELIVMPGAGVIGETLRSSRFRLRYGVNVIALSRAGEVRREALARIPLRLGDLILVHGRADRVAALAADDGYRIVGEIDERPVAGRKALMAAVVFVGALVLAACGVPLAPCCLGGAALVIALRCIPAEDAWRDIHWRSIIVIACMLGFGAAMASSGTADWLAQTLLTTLPGASSWVLLSAVFAATVFLTQPLSNQAAAALVLPIALGVARSTGDDPRAHAVMVALAASCSYLTPLEPACLMVQGPGHLRFSDFVRAGLPLTAVTWLIALLLVPRFWPL